MLDKDSKPITDLKQADFTLRENGVAQTITHFSFETMEPSRGRRRGTAGLVP